MVALRASEVGKRLTDVHRLPPVILVFGADRGLVTEVVQAIARLFGAAADDPFATVRLDGATVAADPSRLVDEARTISLFGGRRLILARDAGRALDKALAPLLAEPPSDAVVVAEAGDLRRGTGLRKLVEDDRAALAIHCPLDGVRDLERMIDEEARALGIAVDPDARAVLADRLGADRAASRSEVQKACLHGLDTGRLAIADVDAVVGDAALSEVSEAVEAAFLGQRETLDKLLRRVLRQDSAAPQLLAAAQRTAHSLELGAAMVAAGTAPNRAVEGFRPPLYGARKATHARILERWTPSAVRRASALIAEATFSTRIMPALAAAVARDALLRIAASDGR